MIDSDTTHSDAKHDNRTGPVDGGLHREIEAVVARLTRYARALTRDVVAADDLVHNCLGRALRKSHLWEKGTDLQAWLFTILHHQHVSRVRSVIRVVGLEGMGYEEAASVVNVPVGTVRSRASRGRETLRKITALFPSQHCRSPSMAANLDHLSRAVPGLAMNVSA